MSGTLWIVGTPIGNLGDLTPRAAEVLGAVALVAAEDTRRTGRLLQGLGLKRPMVSLFEGNERERTAELLARLREGEDVAVVTDGGMPSVSDPGFRIVRASAEEGIDVRVVPGPSAAIAALVVSGLPTDRFAFEGFLPRKAGDRTARLIELRDDPRTLVVFESPVRVPALLNAALEVLGDRRVAVARELTKLHEEVRRGPITEVLAGLGDRELKGEVVVVIAGAPEPVAVDLEACVTAARTLVEGGMRKRDAAKAVAEGRRVSANVVYRALLEALA